MRSRLQATLLALVGCLLLAPCGSSDSSTSSSADSASSSATTAPASATAPTGTGSDQSSLGFEGVPLETGPQLAPAGPTTTTTVDGIHCGAVEQLAYHIHAHLAVFVNGREYSLPGGVGIPGSRMYQTSEGPVAAGGKCFYWLHTHTSDGIIHVESPTERIYALGDFFDEWHQPLSADRVGAAKGRITAFVNGKLWRKSVRDIPLIPHANIQLEIGSPIPPLQTVDWARTQL